MMNNFHFAFATFSLFSANNFAMKGKRKTLNASDVISAMEEMEFQRFIAPLKESLEGSSKLVPLSFHSIFCKWILLKYRLCLILLHLLS